MNESSTIEYLYVKKLATGEKAGVGQYAIGFDWALYAVLTSGKDLDYYMSEHKFLLGKKSGRFLLKCKITRDSWKNLIKALKLVRNIDTEKAEAWKLMERQRKKVDKEAMRLEKKKNTWLKLMERQRKKVDKEAMRLEKKIKWSKINVPPKVKTEKASKYISPIGPKRWPGRPKQDKSLSENWVSGISPEDADSLKCKILEILQVIRETDWAKDIPPSSDVAQKEVTCIKDNRWNRSNGVDSLMSEEDDNAGVPKETIVKPFAAPNKYKSTDIVANFEARTIKGIINSLQRNYNSSKNNIFEAIKNLCLWDTTINIIRANLVQINEGLEFDIIDRLKKQLKSELEKKFDVYTCDDYMYLGIDAFDMLGYTKLWLILGRKISKPLSIDDRIELAVVLWYLQ